MRSTQLKLTHQAQDKRRSRATEWREWLRQEIMTLLNVLTVSLGFQRPMYDFVYIPWAKLAVVNFTSHDACKAHLSVIDDICQLGADHPAIRYVTQAFVQGLAPNIAFFLAKSGQVDAMPHAPRIYEDGIEIPLQQAVDRYVSVQLLHSMQHFVANEGKAKDKGKGKARHEAKALGWKGAKLSPQRSDSEAQACVYSLSL
ncbi:unnamed protein product [Effrenium voratum]|nr:unnamed protein product [Effrenium voratum]